LAQTNLTQFVNPFIGTGQGAADFNMGSSAGNTPPGAAYPFGMALWSPDTTTDSGGYRYEHNTIRGFSLTHFSGRGISCWQDLPFLPVAGSVGDSPVDQWSSYASTFSHDHERAAPGYYSVALDNGVRTELTVTQRTGFARFTFPANGPGTLLVDAGRSANGNWGNTSMNLAGNSELYGSVTSGNCGGSFSYTLYFVVLFDQSAVATGTGDHGTWLTFDTASNAVVQAKVGLSFVSFTNAYTNLTSENTGWDFDGVRARADTAWNARLAAIEVSGGPPDQTTIFYTALYHASIHPSTFSDVNGDYLGFDGRVHNTTRTQYHNIPAWDFHRSLVPLLAITAPDVASDLAQSLVNDAQQDPSGGLPRWVHAATDSCGMFGDDSPAILATTYAFGARDFDTTAALAAMIRDATQPGITSAGCPVREGLEDYLTLGYVSTSTWGSAARTLEYAASDFSISQFAAALGDTTDASRFLQSAQNWRNLFRDGYIVPRKPAGQFLAGYSPDGCNGDAFIEGSGGQYSFMVRFNERALFNAIGGSTAAVARLDHHFQQLNAGPCSEFAFMGNEVSLKTPWMYDFAGTPWKTQHVLHRILTELYANSPGGMPGNDDGGVLSSWVVFASLGLYPEISGVAGLAVAAPVFPDVLIHLAGGGAIHIVAPEAANGGTYLQSLRLNSQNYTSPWIPWSALSSGGELGFDLGASANHSWGTQPDVMPSFDTAH
jgi:predicted alpha-1,2-mannosidase